MANAIFSVPRPKNEPVYDYVPKSKDHKEILSALDEALGKKIEVPMYIGNKEIFEGEKISMHPPHDTKHILGHYYKGDASHVQLAIDAALEAKTEWSEMDWNHRAAIFLRAADLIAGKYRYQMNVATMVCQSKNVFQSEIDSVCEFIDFLRFNVYYLSEIYNRQPAANSDTIWNRLKYRPLEGFVFAVTPFNFTAIAGNLCFAPALCGNTVVWKPSEDQIYSAFWLQKIFKEAGLPDGVINMVVADGPATGDVVFNHPEFAGLHFTGSTKVFQQMWTIIGQNISKYKSYPRIVGETGGKDFLMAHGSSNPVQVATALSRGAFEFQGQKCSAASRAYIAKSIWNETKKHLVEQVESMKMGSVNDTSNFINAVISKASFDRISGYIDEGLASNEIECITGGTYDDSEGYFVKPTVFVTSNPSNKWMAEEIFGPVLTIYVYEDEDFEKTLELVDQTSPYALTGAVFSTDRYAITLAEKKLENSAGNFYINDKPTGAVVGQQPFGGGRASGTNDKAGEIFNLYRWINVQTVKENLLPPEDYKYPFLG